MGFFNFTPPSVCHSVCHILKYTWLDKVRHSPPCALSRLDPIYFAPLKKKLVNEMFALQSCIVRFKNCAGARFSSCHLKLFVEGLANGWTQSVSPNSNKQGRPLTLGQNYQKGQRSAEATSAVNRGDPPPRLPVPTLTSFRNLRAT